MSHTPLKTIIESLLFVSDAPITIDRLCTVLEEHNRTDIREAMAHLQNDYEMKERGIQLKEVAGGYQLRSIPENADYIRRLSRSKTFRFSPSSMEALAIIAYRQPITRAEVEYLRGVDCGGVLKTLLDRKLVRILGKKDIPGKPLIYSTTKEFLEVFSLKNLASLPTLKEIQELALAEGGDQQVALPLEIPDNTRNQE